MREDPNFSGPQYHLRLVAKGKSKETTRKANKRKQIAGTHDAKKRLRKPKDRTN